MLVVLCALSVPFSLAGLNILPAGLSGREPTSAFYPFNPSIFALFVYLPMLGLPIGASVAVLFGWIHAIRHFRPNARACEREHERHLPRYTFARRLKENKSNRNCSTLAPQ